MKKSLLLLVVILAFSCSSNTDDKNEEVCENKVWNMLQVGTEYFATYGPTEAESTSIEVNEETYDHYVALGNVTDGSICWDGTEE